MLIKKAFSLLNKDRKIEIYYVFFFILINGLLEMLSVGMLFPLIKFIMEPSTILNTNFYLDKFLSYFTSSEIISEIFFIFIVLFFFIFLIKNIFMLFIAVYISRFYLRVEHDMGVFLLNKYFNSSLGFLKYKNSSEIIRNTGEQANGFAKSYVYEIIYVATELIILSFLISLLLINFFKEAIFIITILSTFLFLYFFVVKNKIYSLGKISQKIIKERYQNVQESFSSIIEIKIYSLQEKFAKVFSDLIKSKNGIDLRLTFIKIAPRYLIEILLVFSISFGILYLVNLGNNLIEIILPISIFIAVLFRLTPSVNRLLNSIQKIRTNKPLVLNIFSEIDNIDSLNYKSKGDNNFQINFQKKIEIINLNFDYDKRKILNNINFSINCGEKIGIFGKSGGGKTTLLELIVGLYIPTSGEVLVDNNNINKNYSSWMSNIGFIPQKVIMFDDTIVNNITFKDLEKNLDKERLMEILKKVDLEKNLIDEAFTRKIGEGGSNISGGQRQKVAIARALYKRKKLLILDEATKGLDKTSEKKVITNLLNLDNKLTIIFISHDRAILSLLDKIYKLENCSLGEVTI